jgi:hypothetical protein
MSDDKPVRWSDDQLYARLSQPYPTADAASEALQRFTDGVRRLREECGVPEVVLVAAAHVADGLGARVASLACGDSVISAQLAAHGYACFAQPVVAQADRVREIAKGDHAAD